MLWELRWTTLGWVACWPFCHTAQGEPLPTSASTSAGRRAHSKLVLLSRSALRNYTG
jgi:hypothetical protein